MSSHTHDHTKTDDHSEESDHIHHHHELSDETIKDGQYDKVPEGFSGTVYTCPMHLDVRQPTPGSCPICGMGLVLDKASAADDEGDQSECSNHIHHYH